MKFLRYKLIPKSPLGSALQSDTLAGHFLCYIREKEGEDTLKDVISQLLDGDPPFVLSSAYPEGKLPFPAVPPPARGDFRVFVKENAEAFGGGTGKAVLFEALRKFKKFRKEKYISLETWKSQKEGFDINRLFLEWIKKEEKKEKNEKRVQTPHNVIDRGMNRVADSGGLFFTEETFFEEGYAFDLYVKVRPDFEATFRDLMDYMGKVGFGRDRGVGKGVFEIGLDETFSPDDIETPKGTHLLSLSIFSTTKMADWKGTYGLMTKYGKVWNGFGETNPFKKPFLAFTEGAVFDRREIDYASSVLGNIHSDESIVQCTLPLMIPFHWEAS